MTPFPPEEPADERPTLYCFAHAGGGGGFFRSWREPLAEDFDVVPVVLPGRETRLRERPLRSMPQVVDDVLHDLADRVRPPYALFGHSLGSLVAYEVAVALRAMGRPSPFAMVVSGRRAPQLPSRRAPVADLDEAALLVEMSELGGTPQQLMDSPDLLRMFLPTLRADFAVNETYPPTLHEPLDCPVFGFVGDADPLADPDEVAAWRAVTHARFGLRVFRGDHFYLQGPPAGIVAALRCDLSSVRAVADDWLFAVV